MAHIRRTTPKYVYDLPYFERMELCKILDQNDKWEELGGIYMNFDVLTIQTLRREILRGNSPTDELLTKWGHQNHTILELFVLLSKMQHYQAMLVIKQFVDPEYHKLIYEGEQNLCRLFKERQNSKVMNSNCINQKTSETQGTKESNNIEKNINKSNNYNNISVNLNFAKSQNNLPDKIAFINKTISRNEENKIINGQEGASSGINDNNNNNNNRNNENNAQTILMNKDDKNANKGRDQQSKYLKPEIGKDKNMSEISSIAESVGILPVITFKELELATNGWDTSTILGKGGFGTVYKGTWKNTAVAIKRTRNSETDENHSIQIQQILGELKMLNSYRHDNILPLYGFSIDGEDPCLIYQYMPNGSLEDRLLCRHGTKPLTWYQRHNIAVGTARGIQFLHTIGEKPLIHGDIKSANILLDSNFEAKIGDFGLAREGPYNHYTHMKVSRVHGTRPYLPDEFLRHKKFSTKVDTHSFGVVLFELATGLRAYDDQRQHKFLKDLIENTPPNQLSSLGDKKCAPDEQTFTNLVELGKCCVKRKPKDRPEMVIVLQELNAIAVKRDMIAKVQSMLRQNSFSPSTPFEMQVFHDHMSQQKRMSPECSIANHFKSPTRAISPLMPAFHPDPNTSNAASLEAQAAFNALVFNNNPFLNADLYKNDHEKMGKEMQVPTFVANKEGGPSWAVNVKHTDTPTQPAVENKKIHVMDPKNQTPVISVSPPSASQSSSVYSEEEDGIAIPSNETQPEDLDYEYTSDIENFLPLISVLGVKGKSDEKKKGQKEETEEDQIEEKKEDQTEEKKEDQTKEKKEDQTEEKKEDQTEEKKEKSKGESSDSSSKTIGSPEVATSAKGKLLWILDDPS